MVTFLCVFDTLESRFFSHYHHRHLDRMCESMHIHTNGSGEAEARTSEEKRKERIGKKDENLL